MVIFNSFRKDTLDSLKIRNTMAHKKQIRVSTNKGNKYSAKMHSKDTTK